MKRTLGTYIVAEILTPFLLGLLAFTFILLIARLVKLIELVVTRGVPMLEIGKLFGLILPTFLEMTLPMAFLLGILLGLGRLSGHHEILALKASGISPVQITLPIGVTALLVSLLTLVITAWVRPAANRELKKELYHIAKNRVEASLREKIFNDDFPKILIYVEEVIAPGNTLQGVLIVDHRDEGRETVTMSKAAFFTFDESSQTLSLKLFDGTVHERKRGRLGFSQTRFNVYDFKLDLEEVFSFMKKKEREPKEMSLRRLIRTMAHKQEQGLKVTTELMELHQRFAFSVTPLIFALLGVSLSMVTTRSPTSRSAALALCLFWLLFYYTLLSLGRALGERELLPPALALWLPNLTLGLMAAHFFRKALQESPPSLQANLERASLYLNQRLVNLKKRRP